MDDKDGEPHAKATRDDDAVLADLLVRQDALLCGRLATRVPNRLRGAFDIADAPKVMYLGAFLWIAQFDRGNLASFRADLPRPDDGRKLTLEAGQDRGQLHQQSRPV